MASPCPMIAELLWAAPELLPGPGCPGWGTLTGDIFSTAIILQEVLPRTHPTAPRDSQWKVGTLLPLFGCPCLESLTSGKLYGNQEIWA